MRPTSPFNVLFDDHFLGDFTNDVKSVFKPATNIKETQEMFVVDLAVPGMEKTDFKIDLQEKTLTISAEKKSEVNQDNEKFTRREFHYNSFSRSFSLPENVNTDNIEAKYVNGILTITIPKLKAEEKTDKKEIVVS